MAVSMSVISSINWQASCDLQSIRMNKDILPVLKELRAQKSNRYLSSIANCIVNLLKSAS